jgi:hypothetical protein
MLDPDRKPLKGRKAARCPICRKPAGEATKPFCSDRCRQVDLNRWLGEQYRIPSEEPGLPEGEGGGAEGEGPGDGRSGPGSW